MAVERRRGSFSGEGKTLTRVERRRKVRARGKLQEGSALADLERRARPAHGRL